MTQLTSQVGDMSASVQQTASTVADLNGNECAVGSEGWHVSGGKHYVSGLQLGMDGSGQSQFLVQADTFDFGVYVPNGDKAIWSSVSRERCLYAAGYGREPDD